MHSSFQECRKNKKYIKEKREKKKKSSFQQNRFCFVDLTNKKKKKLIYSLNVCIRIIYTPSHFQSILTIFEHKT